MATGRSAGTSYTRLYSTFLTLRRTKWRDSGGALLGFNLVNLFHNPDAVDPNIKTVTDCKADGEQTTGWQRLRLMFSEDAYGHISPELSSVVNGVMMGTFTGAVIGGTLFSKSSFVKFIDENQGSAFQNMFEAKKQLQTQVTLGFARGAWIWGWRLGLFCGSFLLCTTSISVYRGKSSILEYIIAGTATGSVFKLKQGPRAMAAGGIMGGGLGAVAGCISLGVMYLTGTSMEDLRYWQHKWREEKQTKKVEQLRQLRTKELDALTLNHEGKIDPSKDFMKTDN